MIAGTDDKVSSLQNMGMCRRGGFASLWVETVTHGDSFKVLSNEVRL